MSQHAVTQRVVVLVLGLVALEGTSAAAQQAPSPTRRAVVVGISRYLYFPADEQLHYAAADAQSFYAFLRSKAGGAVPEGNIRLLLDTAAKGVEIEAALRWLRVQSNPGDEAIIYFAGHGDVQAMDGSTDAYLMATDAMPHNYLAGGDVAVSAFSAHGRTIAQKGASTLVITDAFRAGRPVDKYHTAAILLRPWDGVTKFVSNRPEQFSLEGAQWGGGHGVFTYFLVAGLEGLADANSDGVVTLDELVAYVSDNVRRETSEKQTPVWSGDTFHRVAVVDTATLRAARARITHH